MGLWQSLQLQVAVFHGDCYSWGWKDLFPFGAFLLDRGFPQICLVLDYTVTGIDVAAMAADFATGIWVVAIVLISVIRFSRWCWVHGQSWVGGHRLGNHSCLNLLFTGALDLIFFSTFLGTRVFCGKAFLSGKRCWCVVAIGVGCQACLLVLSTFSSFLSGMDRDRALCSRVCML